MLKRLARFIVAIAALSALTCAEPRTTDKSVSSTLSSTSEQSAVAAVHEFRLPIFSLHHAHLDDSLSLSTLRAKPVVLTVWATWCKPCVEAHPLLREVAHERSDIQFVAVVWKDRQANVLQYFRDHGEFGFPNLLAEGSSFGRDYLVKGLPHTVFIDSAGVIRRTFLGGPLRRAQLLALIDDAFGTPATAQ